MPDLPRAPHWLPQPPPIPHGHGPAPRPEGPGTPLRLANPLDCLAACGHIAQASEHTAQLREQLAAEVPKEITETLRCHEAFLAALALRLSAGAYQAHQQL